MSKLSKCCRIGVCLWMVGASMASWADEHCIAPQPKQESFSPADANKNTSINGVTWDTPWGYEKPENANRKYPVLVIGHHGEARERYLNEYAKQYPAFVVVYQKHFEVDGATLSDHIDAVIASKGYRIDLNRLYLTGWSQGGSGGYALIQGFASRGKAFACFNRIAGMSETELPDAVVPKTAVWYHVGQQDGDLMKQVAAGAYAFVKNHPSNKGVLESTNTDAVTYSGTAYTRNTKTLTLNGTEIMKVSEYVNVGHNAHYQVYSDPGVLAWIFSRSICENKAVLTVLSPNGGERWQQGTVLSITWTVQNYTGPVNIELWRGEARLGGIAANVAATMGRYDWTVGRLDNGNTVTGGDLKIRVLAPNGTVLGERSMQ